MPRAPLTTLQAILTVQLMAKPKDDTRVRPIGVGTAFRRLTSALYFREHGDELKTAAGPHQYGVGVTNGITLMYKALQHTFLHHHGRTILHLDLTNAFNLARREELLSIAAKVAPHAPGSYILS